MEFLASLFVGKPQNILAVAVVCLMAYLALRFVAHGIARHPLMLFIASVAWGIYAFWEWLVQSMTP